MRCTQPITDRYSTETVYGERIREARVNVMMGQRTLALLMNIQVNAVVAWEAGQYQPLGGDLDRLVEIFQQPRHFYFKEPVKHFDEGTIFFKERED